MENYDLPIKIKMQRDVLLRKYEGILEIAGHSLAYSLEYSPTSKPGVSESKLTIDNSNNKLKKIYSEIGDQLQDILRKQVIQYEARLQILQKKMTGGSGVTLAGGSFSSSRDAKESSQINMGKIQIEFEHNIQVSKDLENILRNTHPQKG